MPKPWEPKWRDGSYYVDFTFEGARVRRSLGVRDKGSKTLARKLAKKVYDTTLEDHVKGPVKRGTPFWEAAGSYVQGGGEARFLPPIIQHFGEGKDVEDITEMDIVSCGMALYPTHAPDTRRRQVRVPINAVKNFAAGKAPKPSTDRKTVRWLTPEEFERLLDAADAHLIPKIAFLIGSGCRTGEMIALDADDWRPETQQAWIAGEEDGAGKTVTSTRWVRLPSRSISLIGDIPAQGRVFLTPKGQPYKLRMKGGGQIQAAFNKARDRAGLESDGPRKVTPHVLRHSWATWFYAHTQDFGALMDLGGWSKSDMANRYRKIAPDDLGERLLKFGWDFRQKSVRFEGKTKLRVVKQ